MTPLRPSGRELDPVLASGPAGPRPVEAQEVAEVLVGGQRTLNEAAIAELSGVSVHDVRRFWHALGFPAEPDGEASFSEGDLAALGQVAGLVRDERLAKATALAMIRAVARTADRLGSWQVAVLAEHLARTPVGSSEPSFPDPLTAQQVAAQVIALADDLEPLLVYAWRRHLADAVGRLLADAADADRAARSTVAVRRFVGFADLVSFASVVERLSERDLATAVQRFEALATDIVTAHGARVVKTVGDEVLFTSRTPAPGAAIGLDLIDAFAGHPVLPEIRVGCAYGPVVSRLGDVFGTTVNRAARLAAIAYPGTVLGDSGLATALTSQSGFRMHPLRRRAMRGIGEVTPYVVTRQTTTTRLGRNV